MSVFIEYLSMESKNTKLILTIFSAQKHSEYYTIQTHQFVDPLSVVYKYAQNQFLLNKKKKKKKKEIFLKTASTQRL